MRRRARPAALIKLGGDLAVLTDRRNTHATHDQLEHGQPVKRYKGEAFRPA